MSYTLTKTRRELADIFLESLRESRLPWERPWKTNVPGARNMVNAVTGKYYRGGNAVLLWLAAMRNGFSDNRYCTFNQAKSRGWSVKKGVHGFLVEFWLAYETNLRKYFTFEEAKERIGRGESEERDFTLAAKTSIVFNAAQIDGIPEREQADPPEYGNAAAEEVFSTYCRAEKIGLLTGGAEAFYTPGDDTITLPPRESFVSEIAYYGTAFHETVHSTAPKSRADRDVNYRGEGRAYEELVAEMGGTFTVQALFGRIPDGEMDNHVAYVQSWAEGIKKNPNDLIRAIEHAERAADFIAERGEMERFLGNPAKARETREEER